MKQLLPTSVYNVWLCIFNGVYSCSMGVWETIASVARGGRDDILNCFPKPIGHGYHFPQKLTQQMTITYYTSIRLFGLSTCGCQC